MWAHPIPLKLLTVFLGHQHSLLPSSWDTIHEKQDEFSILQEVSACKPHFQSSPLFRADHKIVELTWDFFEVIPKLAGMGGGVHKHNYPPQKNFLQWASWYFLVRTWAACKCSVSLFKIWSRHFSSCSSQSTWVVPGIYDKKIGGAWP